MSLKKLAAAAVALAATLALSACLLTPGRFTSTLDLRRDGTFAFTYTGEIRALALSKLAERSTPEPATFEPTPCLDEQLKERTCTHSELDDQRKAWDADQKASAERRQREAEQMKAVLGGIDPSSPKAAEELAARLRRQLGWKKVEYKGDGLYLVDYAIAGRIDHDFAFPTIERFPFANAFVQMTLRNDRSVRVEAPAFGASGANASPLAALMAAGAASATSKDQPATLSNVEGTFTLTTDGVILANNTDEGPRPAPNGQVLAWAIAPLSQAAPTALIQLTR